MKVIIHGGFIGESLTNPETKKAKQDSLGRIVEQAYQFLETHSALETDRKSVV